MRNPGKSLRMCSPLLPVIALALTLTSNVYASPPPQEPPPPSEVRVNAADDGAEIDLSEGQVLVVSLEANPSTGYTWQVFEPRAEAQTEPVLRQMGVVDFEPHSTLLGAPGTQTLRFEAVAEGRAALKLVYRRPWEPHAEPAETFTLQVRGKGPFAFGDATPATPTPETPIEPPIIIVQEPEPDLPSTYNWCSREGCTPVRDQGYCGSCWAFATVGVLESSVRIQETLPRDLSEQYLVSCNTDGWGCNGGLWAHNYHAWKVPPGEPGAGAINEGGFPYAAEERPCNPPHTHQEKLDSWQYVGNSWSVPPANDIKRAIYEQGPVGAAVCVGPAFQSYHGGLFETDECTLVNHAVVLVGWDDTQGTDGVWFLRNSWGPEWGEEGYMRIGYGVSNAGYGANYVVYSPSGCYGLTTAVNPGGSGAITAEPAPNCGFQSYEPGTEVRLSPVPASGWQFTGWTGDVSTGSSEATVTVDGPKSVTANFRPALCASWALPTLGLVGYWSHRRKRVRHG